MNLPKAILFGLILFLLPFTSFSQREADNWIFGLWAGLNFTSGDPEPIFVPLNGTGFSGTTMSDSSGNILFYYGGNKVWNRNHEIMMNGTDLLPEGTPARYGEIAFPKPGTNTQYYLFGIGNDFTHYGIYYSVVDMTLDGGLGGVTSEKNIPLTAAAYAQDKLCVLKNSTGDGYWLITRLFNDDRFTSFRITAAGVDPVPVYSSTGIFRPLNGAQGPLKVSLDKQHLFACYHTHPYPNFSGMEVCSFDNESGAIDLLYYFKKPDSLYGNYQMPADCEISPDSRYLYVHWLNGSYQDLGLYQYDMHLVEDSASFINSGIYILNNYAGLALRLANDGRIYFHYETDSALTYQDYYLGMIQKPWEHGTACEADTLAVYLGGRMVAWWLPNMLLDYLYRFEWEGDRCQFSPITFIPHFVPAPDSVRWFFDEFAPGSTSSELSPTYAFKYPGIHEVEVDIWYPTGRFEHTSREIEIYPTPQPDLGPDTMICNGASLTLSAGCTADLYSWSTGQIGNPQITVTDSGTYWVSATFLETGCQGYDTVHVDFYPEIELDTNAVTVTPTSCGGANGSITGLYALGPTPLAYLWLDLSGNPYGTAIDATGLPAGQYYLTITDANGCQNTSPVYTVHDAGNLQMTQVLSARPHCFRDDGELVVVAFSPSGSTLEFSVDDGVSYQSDSIFTGLYAGTYVIRIRDENGCEGFYEDNPVVLTDIPGPQVTQTIVTDESDGQQNGSIEITATGSTPVLLFSIDDGGSWQADNGTFTGLSAGTYYCVVKDGNDCDTSFTVELQNEILTWLQAVTGPGGHCLGNSATVPIEVSNFNNVATFELKLSYNASSLQCDGYAGVIPELAANFTGWVNQAAGEITLQWQDDIPLSLPQQQAIAELVFTPTQAGQGLLDWYTGPAGSAFANPAGDTIPAQFSAGQVTIYEPPMIISPSTDTKTVCPGDFVSFFSIATGNQGPFTYLWTWPDGHTSEDDPSFWSVAKADAGDYTLLATDFMGCTDQKTISLVVSDNPVAAFHGTDTLVVDSGYVLEAGTGQAHYRWNTGDSSESIEIYSEGMYSVEMESQAGCIGSDSVYIVLREAPVIEPSQYFYIPNAFTPDGDGRNDVFRVVSASPGFTIYSLQFTIYDRWGGRVFETDDLTQGWDGTKNGRECPAGAYVYRITFQVQGVPGTEGEQLMVGTVVLVR